MCKMRRLSSTSWRVKTKGGEIGGETAPEQQRAKAMDSIFGSVKMGRDTMNTKGLADFAAQFKRKGA